MSNEKVLVEIDVDILESLKIDRKTIMSVSSFLKGKNYKTIPVILDAAADDISRLLSDSKQGV